MDILRWIEKKCKNDTDIIHFRYEYCKHIILGIFKHHKPQKVTGMAKLSTINV